MQHDCPELDKDTQIVRRRDMPDLQLQVKHVDKLGVIDKHIRECRQKLPARDAVTLTSLVTGFIEPSRTTMTTLWFSPYDEFGFADKDLRELASAQNETDKAYLEEAAREFEHITIKRLLKTYFSDSTIARPLPKANDLNADTNGETERRNQYISRIIRDIPKAHELKFLYENHCQTCDHVIQLADGTTYSEAHHIRPLGRDHDGPDSRDNILVLCPNHHTLCDYFAIRLNIDTLNVHSEHTLKPEYIAYHNKQHEIKLSLDHDL